MIYQILIDFKDFMNLYKKCTAELYYFLVVDTALASDNQSFTFQKEFLRKNIKTNRDN